MIRTKVGRSLLAPAPAGLAAIAAAARVPASGPSGGEREALEPTSALVSLAIA